MENGKCWRSLIIAFCILHFTLCIGLTGCSVPNLESPECAAARDVAKQYYSLAIGGDPMSHPGVLARLKTLRAGNFSTSAVADGDQFYLSSVQPTSSRVDGCTLESDGRVKVDVTVIWRVNETNSTRKDVATLGRSNDAWLIERIDVGTQPQF